MVYKVIQQGEIMKRTFTQSEILLIFALFVGVGYFLKFEMINESFIKQMTKEENVMNIEDTIGEQGLPVNTIAMANRLIEILKENKTNCASDLLKYKGKKEELLKFRKCLWLINQQVHGALGTVNISDERWELTKKGE